MWFKKTDKMVDDLKIDDAQKIIISGMWDTLKRYDAYIATVNFKCGLLTSFNAAIVFSILSKFDLIIKNQQEFKIFIVVLCIASLFLCIASLSYVFQSIWPNLSSGSTSAGAEPSVIFFGSVSTKFNAESYSRKMKDISHHDYMKDLSIQVHEMAIITSMKMASIEKAGKFSKYNLYPVALIMLGWIFNIVEAICLA